MNATFPGDTGAAGLDALCIDTLRFLSVDMVQNANSGHPGLPLGAAPMAYVLWTHFLKHHPANPQWFDRDRFVLSAGHGSALLYSLLHLTGYALPLEQLKQFRKWGSIAPGHPERGLTPGVEVTTGPLGQGFANGVGMAIAEASLAARYNRDGFAIVDHFTYGIVSDGDLMEGVAAEAASLAGHLQLGKLIYLYDDNGVTLSAGTGMAFSEDVAARFKAYGWHTQVVEDGNDTHTIESALHAARAQTARPSLILVRTHLGYGSPGKQDTFEAHGSPLGEEEVRLTKRNLGWPEAPAFHIPEPARAHFAAANEKGARAEAQWDEALCAYKAKFPELARELAARMQAGAAAGASGWEAAVPEFAADAKGMATRVASGKIMNAIAAHQPALIGGSADLDPSTFTMLKGCGDFEPANLSAHDRQGSSGGGWSRAGRNLHFGVREHAMGALMNGMAAHGGVVPFGATFLIFSDYMRPSIRLAALMGLHVVYLFTHDSIALGEDGPTHQPVEQLASLRAIPGLTVIRPADANETAVAWRVALETGDRPVALVLSRQDLPTLDRALFQPADGLRRGAYVLADAPGGSPDLILVASGAEVSLAVAARERLARDGIHARVVSMPSWELFDAQPPEYRDTVFPPALGARLAVEAGVSQGWHRYLGDGGGVLAVDRFGASAPGPVMLQEYGFTVDNVCARAARLLRR
ncbi:transketolase [Cupriavidus sp. 30B13]|uniref:transketolase n=1 Tax=Cupriavidus sp. 30B13 TaxID=3384241 RepID=UPI003B908BBC